MWFHNYKGGHKGKFVYESDEDLLFHVQDIGAERIEFYTGPYAYHYHENPESAIEPHVRAASVCRSLNLGMNAGP